MSIRCFLAVLVMLPAVAVADDTVVSFDLPSSIECRDKTPPEFAQANPTLKVVEARFRVSARIVSGQATDVVDYLYVMTSPDRTWRVQDYLPNTTLESTVADDQIEFNNAAEKAHATGIDARVVYKMFTVGGTHTQSGKKSEASHFKQIASQDLVLAAGTTEREYGVFFRIRPSRFASLEGSREFTLTAVVPKSWRGDRAMITCTARANKSSLLSSSVVTAGDIRTEVGLYLSGDAEALGRAEALRVAHEHQERLLRKGPAKDSVLGTLSNPTSLFSKKSEAEARQAATDAEAAVRAAQRRLRELSR